MRGKKVEPLAVVHRDCAGIDVGKRKHYVAVDPSRFDEPVGNFGTFTQDLESMAEWLSSCGVREVAMESTGVYWIPAFEVLDRAGPVPRAAQHADRLAARLRDERRARQPRHHVPPHVLVDALRPHEQHPADPSVRMPIPNVRKGLDRDRGAPKSGAPGELAEGRGCKSPGTKE